MKHQNQQANRATKNRTKIVAFGKWIFSAAVFLAGIHFAAAQDIWNNSTGDGSWFTPANWSSGTPTAGDNANVGNNTFASIQGSTTAVAQNLTNSSGGVIIGGSSPGSLAVSGAITEKGSGQLILDGGSISYNQLVIDAGGSYSDTFGDTNILVGAGAGITTANGITATFNSQLMGTDGLTTGGGGTVVLNNNNSYTGGTTVSAGTLQVGNSGTTGTLGAGDVTDNGNLAIDHSDTITITNNINGSGTVSQIGRGTTIFTGDNSYSGGTLISSGTLQVGDGGADGSLGTGNVTNLSSLVFNQGENVTIDNLISGSGGVSFIGVSTNILTADNTYSGGTMINSNSTVQVGNGGPSGSLGTGTVQNIGALIFDRSDDVTNGNQITGSGSLTQAGAGTLILTGNSDYTGATTINSGGTLQIGDGGNSGAIGSGAIHDNGTFVFDNNNGTIFLDNTIDGTGNFIFAGTNALVLDGTNTYGGGTSVTGGGKLWSGSSSAFGTGDFNLQNGSLEFNHTGTNSVTVNIGGNYVQGANGTLILSVGGSSPNEYDQLHVTNTATLGGTLGIIGYNNYTPEHNDQISVLEADGGVFGTFAALTNESLNYSPLLNPSLAYSATNVLLEFSQLSIGNFLATNNVKLTRNQTAVAAAVDSIASSTATNNVKLINALDYFGIPSGAINFTNALADLTNGLPKAFNQISPEQLTAMSVAALAEMDSMGDGVLKRVNELHSDYAAMYESQWGSEVSPDMGAAFTNYVNRQWNYYADAPVNFANVSGDANADGYSINSLGVMLGADKRLAQQLYFGAALGYSYSSAGLDNGGSMTMHTFDGDIYATWFDEFGFHLEGMAGGEFNLYDTKRGTIGGTASGTANGTGWTGLIGGGYDWNSDSWKIGPQADVQYESSDVDGFTETGSSAPLSIGSQKVNAMHSQIGLNTRYRYLSGRWTYINPEVYFGWRHDFEDSTLPITSQFASGSGTPFTVYSPQLGRDSIVFSLGISVQWNPDVNTYANFTAQTGRSGYDSENIDLGVRWSF